MNEQDILGRLAELGADGPAGRPAGEALRAGRKARTRRRVLGAGGSALSLGVVVALILTLSPSSGGADTVIAADGGDGASTGQSSKPADAKPSIREIDYSADENNAAIMAEIFGKDFNMADGDVPEATLRAGSPSAEGLPDGFEVSLSLSAGYATDLALPQYCKPMVEKGFVQDGCVDRGKVQENWGRWGSTEQYPQQTAGETVRVLFQRADDVLVWADLGASGQDKDTTDTDRKALRDWLENFRDKLAALVADPDVKPTSFIQADGDPDPDPADARSVENAEELCVSGVRSTIKVDTDPMRSPHRNALAAVEDWAAQSENGYPDGHYDDFDGYLAPNTKSTGPWFYAVNGTRGKTMHVLTVRRVDKHFYISGVVDCR